MTARERLFADPLSHFPLQSLLLALFKSSYTHRWLLLSLAWSVLAKVLELKDNEVSALTGNVVVGHALKHLFALGYQNSEQRDDLNGIVNAPSSIAVKSSTSRESNSQATLKFQNPFSDIKSFFENEMHTDLPKLNVKIA